MLIRIKLTEEAIIKSCSAIICSICIIEAKAYFDAKFVEMAFANTYMTKYAYVIALS